MSRGRRHDTNRGPQFKTLHRSDKVKQWAQVIQTMLRKYGGDAIADKDASDYADEFWKSLEIQQTPIVDIVAVPGETVVTWVLAKYCAALVPAQETS